MLGPGPIGLMGVQLVKALGATKVILTGTRYERLNVGKALGADVIVNIHEQDAVEVVRAETGGLGADLVLECSGSPDAAAQALMDGYRLARQIGNDKLAVEFLVTLATLVLAAVAVGHGGQHVAAVRRKGGIALHYGIRGEGDDPRWRGRRRASPPGSGGGSCGRIGRAAGPTGPAGTPRPRPR